MGPRPDGRGDGGRPSQCPGVSIELQWVRGLTAAVMLKWRPALPPRVQASMGPRPDGRGDGLRAIRTPRNRLRLQWVRGLTAAVMAEGAGVKNAWTELQWVRGLTAAVMSAAR